MDATRRTLHGNIRDTLYNGLDLRVTQELSIRLTSEAQSAVSVRCERPCHVCGLLWTEANVSRELPSLPILDACNPPIPQKRAGEHLRLVHGLGAFEFEGVNGVWLCGVLSGMCFSDGVTGFTFEDRVRNELAYRARLHRLTVDNLRMEVRWLHTAGILTPRSIRAGAIRLHRGGGPTEAQIKAGEAMMQILAKYALLAARRSAGPP